MITRLLLAAIILLLPVNLYAEKTVLYSGSPVVVKTAYLNPTEVRFEGEEIATIVTGFPHDSISLENTVDTLFIQPLVEDLAGDIYVIMKDGRSKILSLIPDIPDTRDRSVRIISAVQDITDRIEKIKHSGITPAGLIRAMILGEDLDGVSISPTNQVIIELPVRIIAHTVYDAVFLKGYITDMAGPGFDIKTIYMRGLLAGAVHNGKGYFVLENIWQ
ncbi:MAG: hypothetical protein IBX72_11330 [Nitrospirae bacterium]|nr:hypothetical protein [Nitrospirota bacterium]